MSEPRGERVLAALVECPGGPELIELSARDDEASLVGGAVRDLLLERTPRELDVVVGDSAPFAQELAALLGASVTVNARFHTALVDWPGGRIDVTTRRSESYPAPGALPEVRPGSLSEDLARRDFTVNAIALTLAGAARGELHATASALADLDARRVRVLHERSFVDDPTRLLRLARYAARLGFTVEQHTAQLAAEALANGALFTVTRARVGAELRLALSEPDAPAVLAALGDGGLLEAIHPGLAFDEQLARSALELLHPSPLADREQSETLLLAVLASTLPGSQAYVLLSELEIPARQRDRALRAADQSEEMARRLARARSRSQVYEAAAGAGAEGVALAGAWSTLRGTDGGGEQAAREWLLEIGGTGLLIDGDDLLAAGVPPGPEIGRRLHAVLTRKLDGELAGDGREGELAAALEGRP